MLLSSFLAIGALVSTQTPRQPGFSVRQVVISPSGDAVAAIEGPLYLLSKDPSKPVMKLKSDGIPFHCAFTPDGKDLVASMSSGGLTIWDVATGEQVARLKRSTSSAMSLCVSSDGTMAATGDRDRTVEVWDLKNQTLLCTNKPDQEKRVMHYTTGVDANGQAVKIGTYQYDVLHVSISPDNRFVASQGGSTLIWSIPDGNLMKDLP